MNKASNTTALSGTASISVDNILKSVYAICAAEKVTHGYDSPALIGKSHQAMLRNICRDTLAGIVFIISRHVAGTNVSADPVPDIIEIDLQDVSPQHIGLIARNIEITSAAAVLAAIWMPSQPDYADMWRRSYEKSCETLSYLTLTPPGAIQPG